MNPTYRYVQKHPPGTGLARYLVSLKLGRPYAEKHYQDSPAVGNALDARFQRTAVPAMNTGNEPDLVSTGVLDATTLLLLSGVDAFEAARPHMIQLPFETPAPRDLDAGTGGGWVGEGAALPAASYAYDTIVLKPKRAGSVMMVTNELVRNPRAESILTAKALRTAGRLDSRLFLDPDSTAADGFPASITASGTQITATGNVAADLAALLAAVGTDCQDLCWLLRGSVLAEIAAALGGGAVGVPATLLGLPVILCPSAPPPLIVPADLGNIACASTPLDFELASNATIEMSDAPSNDSGSPVVGTSLVSAFQTHSSVYRIWRFLNWQVLRENAVAYLVNAGSPL